MRRRRRRRRCCGSIAATSAEILCPVMTILFLKTFRWNFKNFIWWIFEELGWVFRLQRALIFVGNQRQGFPLQPRDQRQRRSGGGADAAYRSPHGGWRLLLRLQGGVGMEIYLCLWRVREIQGGENSAWKIQDFQAKLVANIAIQSISHISVYANCTAKFSYNETLVFRVS